MIADKLIYNRLKKKDKDAFIKAYDKYLEHIYRFVYFKVGSREEAEDLTSYIFLKTWDYIQNNQLKDHKTLKALLYKVARNAVIDHYRKQKPLADASIDDENLARTLVDDKQDMHKQVMISDEYEAITLKLKELKDEYREAIILRYVNEMSIGEVAEALGKNKGNTRVLIYRALNALKELTGEENDINRKTDDR